MKPFQPFKPQRSRSFSPCPSVLSSVPSVVKFTPPLGGWGVLLLLLLCFVSAHAQNPGNALAFDGTDDHVVMADNDASITTAFTLETWVLWQPNAATDVQFLCGKATEQMEIHTGGGAGANGLRFIPTTGVYLDAANVLPTGTWTHVVCTYDATASVAHMYINGSEVTLTNNGSNPLGSALQSSTISFYLGNRYANTYYLKGSLDEFRLYDGVLTQAEIQQNWNTTINPATQTGLVSYYNFNQGTAGGDNTGSTTLTDLTVNFNGTLTNFALTGATSNWVASGATVNEPVVPGVGNALNFDGTNDYVAIPDNGTDPSDYTLTTWVRQTTAGLQFICGKGVGTMEIHTTATHGLRFIPGNSVFLDVDNVLPLGIWTHVAIDYNPSAASAHIYINGQEVPYTLTGSLATLPADNASPYNVGRRSDGSYPFNGSLDEFALFNSALSQGEIQTLMTGGASSMSPAMYYTFNQGTAGADNTAITSLFDYSGNGNTGTLTNFALTGSTSNWVESYAMVIAESQAATDISETGFTANWLTASNASLVENYLLEVATDTAFTSLVSAYNPATIANTETSLAVSVTTNQPYYYRVHPEKTSVSGQAAWSQRQTVNPVWADVEANSVTNVMGTSATVNATLKSLGASAVTAHGVCWNTTGDPTTANDYTDLGTATETGAYTAGPTGLTLATTYYVRAYATNGSGTAYSNGLTFTTKAATPEITTDAVTAIAGTSATGNITLVYGGTSDITDYGICWRTASGPTVEANTGMNHTEANAAPGSYPFAMAPLDYNTTYYVRAYAANADGTVYGNEVSFTTFPFEGSGTEASPYLITSLADLRALSESPAYWAAGYHFAQTADIDATETQTWNSGSGFSPIGNGTTKFTGTYNGQGHTLTGLYLNNTVNYTGLFGYLQNSTVSNLTLAACNITGPSSSFVGGIGGIAVSSAISRCNVTGNLTGYTVGGIVGVLSGGSILDCHADGNLNGVNVGLIAGRAIMSSTIENCTTRGYAHGSDYAGGLAGELSIDATINQCASSATTEGVTAGGLVGYMNGGTISHSYATGNATGTSFSGGLVGYYDTGNLNNCYATGNVSGRYTGGLVGNSNSNASVTNCYASGRISATGTATGGLIGSCTGTVSGSYFNTETTELTVGIGDNLSSQTVTGLSTAQMKQAASFMAGVLGNSDWAIAENQSYPALTAVNNAPFAFADTLKTPNTIIDIAPFVLLNDYDYETGQTALVCKIESAEQGTFAGSVFTFAADTGVVEYRVGELLAPGDTLWGNRAKAYLSNKVVTTHAVTNIRGVTATCSMALLPHSGIITDYGICWGTASGPTVEANTGMNHTEANAAPGSYSFAMAGLTTSTTYYVRGYATGTSGAVYGNEVSFTTKVATPEMTTNAITNIFGSSATGNLSIMYTGDTDISDYGICWGTASGPTVESHTGINHTAAAAATGDYSFTMSPLSGSTMYYVRAYATNAGGTAYGNEVTFTSELAGDGSQANPFQVSSLWELQIVSEKTAYWAAGYYFIQTANIDASATAGWNSGSGFSPIGSQSAPFRGSYNGQGHTVTGLTINRPATDNVGLFGYIASAISTIQNLGIVGCTVTGGSYNTGGLAGYNEATMANCYCTGTVSGANQTGGLLGYNLAAVSGCYSSGTVTASSYAGGLMGYNDGAAVSDCYSTASVSCPDRTGGLIGENARYSTLSNCYAAGAVSGTTYTGGLVGYNRLNTTFTNCFFNTETSGPATGIGYDQNSQTVTGLTTAQMKQAASFTGWNIGSSATWAIAEDQTYPALLQLNNAPFAFGESLTTTGQIAASELLANDYDYETLQNKLVVSVESVTNGSYSAGYITLDASLTSGQSATVTYRVGETPDGGATLWGSLATSTLTKTSTVAWNGTGNWSETAYWTNSVLPATSDVVVVETGTLTVTGNNEVSALTINSGAILVIAPNQTLTVTGTLTNHADSTGLVIQSTASGTGRIINGTSGVRASVQQFIAEDKWHYMGIPFAGTPKLTPMLKGLWVMGSNEPTATHGTADGWAYLQATDLLSSGNGFAVYHDMDTTVTIYGTLNATGQTVPVSWKDADHGWNLISNPYPCVVDWDYLRSNSGLTGTNDAIYVYDAANASYATYIDGVSAGSSTQDRYIAPMQGFFVRSTAAGSVAFTESAKASGAATFKSSNIDQIIRLSVTGSQVSNSKSQNPNTKFQNPNSKIQIPKSKIENPASSASTGSATGADNTVIRITTQSTENFDAHYDAYKLLSIGSTTPQLYTAWNGDDYSVNSIPEITEGTVIPLKVLAQYDGECTLALSELSNYGYTYPVMLHNPATGELVNLENDDYHFTATAGETVALQLLFTKNQTGVETVDLNKVSIYGSNQVISIKADREIRGEVTVFDINGRKIVSDSMSGTSKEISLDRKGVFIVHLQTGTQKHVQKIIF